MATGFVQRFKGKVAFDKGSFWMAGQPIYGAAAAGTVALVSSSLGYSTVGAAFTALQSSGTTTKSIAHLKPPPFIGFDMMIQNPSGSSLILMASTDGSITFNGSTLSVATSTGSTALTLEIVATSSANWAIVGAFPGTYTSTGGVNWLLSTSS